MLPQTLIIKGLYSYKEEVVIDFTTLMSEGLFGIFGAVGSGKSSILEAMILALYGKTDRIVEQRNFNIINLNSKEISITFFFKHADETYKFIYQNRKRKNDLQSVATPVRKAYKIVNDDEIPLDSVDAEKIIGIKYEQFLKIVILPQGSFAEFINMTESKRGEMIKSLFHLHAYDLSDKVKAMKQDNGMELQKLEGALIGLNLEEDSVIQEWQQQVATLTMHKGDLDKQLAEEKKLLDELSKAKANYEQLEEAMKKMASLDSQKNAIDEQRKIIAQYNIYNEHFKTPLQTLQQAEQEIHNYTKLISDKSNELKTNKEAAEDKMAKLQDIEQNYGNQDTIPATIEQLQQYILRIQAQEKRQPLQEQLAQVTTKINHEKESLSTAVLSLDNLATKQELLSIALAEEPMWIQVKNDWDRLETLQANVLDYDKRLGGHEDKITKINQLKAKVVATFLDEQSATCKLNELIAKLATLKESFILKLNNTQSLYKSKVQEQSLADLVHELKDDVPCPLCGSLEHPHHYQTDDQQQVILHLENEAKAINKSISEIDNYSILLTREKEEFIVLNKERNDILEQKKNCTEEIQKLQESLHAIEEAQDKQIVLAKIGHLQNQRNEYNANVEKEKRLKKVTQSSPIESLAEQQKIIEKEITMIDASIAAMRIESEAPWSEMNAAQLIEWSKIYRNQLDAHKKLTAEMQAVQEQKTALQAECTIYQDRCDATQDKVAQIQAEIESLTTTHEIAVSELEYFNQHTINAVQLNKQIQDFDQAYHIAQHDSKVLKKLLEEQPYDATTFENKNNLVAKLYADEQNTVKLLTELMMQLRNHEEKKKRHEQIQKQYHTLLIKDENLKVLADLFKGNGFVNFASQQYLKHLFYLANTRFQKMTDHRLKLVYDDEGKFLVQDFLNEGALRSIKTLSGGQTFQASLALALSLSEMLQLFSKHKQHFFFLDEGFGSLDNASLQIVMDTLRALRHEQKIVGLISHIDDMKRDIDYYISVTNTMERGSVITKSYEA